MNHVHLALGAAIVALAVIGLCWVLARVAAGLERACYWLSWRFRGDDEDDYAEPLEELPPERSREELGFTGPQPAIDRWPDRGLWAPTLERRAPWWEAEHRAAYESLGFEYPSGLLARVRELAP